MARLDMKSSLLLVAVSCFSLATGVLHATTPKELTGTYTGTSTFIYSNGTTITVPVDDIVRASGKIIQHATVNGQVQVLRGRYHILSDTIIEFQNGSLETVGFYTFDGNSLDLLIIGNDEATGVYYSAETRLTRVH
jgi:hypothetical protein